MSVKKLLVLSAAAALAAIGATVAIAGGPDHMVMPSEPAFQNSVYVDLHAGYADSDWTDFNANNLIGAAGTSLFAPNSHGHGGFAGGVDLGYTITPHIAVEGGWMYLPRVRGAVTALGTTGATGVGGVTFAALSTATVKSWLAYAAAKLSVPVAENFSLYGKIGAGYRALNYAVPATTLGALTGVGLHGHYWAPVFGAGLQYCWGSWQLGAQYLHLPGDSRVNYANTAFGAPNAAPEVNLYTGFLGYKFNV